MINRRKFKKRLRNNYKGVILSYAYDGISLRAKRWIESDRRLQIASNNFRSQLIYAPRYMMKLRGYK